jgi:two-component system, OmpR family, phosphate regulon sensor histidine kinase PhoR
VAWPALRRLIAYAVLAGVAGMLAGELFDVAGWGAAAGLALFLARQLYYLAALRAWVDHPKRVELPEPRGTWGEVYEKLLDLQRRNRRRKRRLAAMLAQFRASAEALPDGVVLMEERGEIVWFNTAAQALLGLRGAQDTGQRLPNLLRHPDFAEYFMRGDFEKDIEIPSAVNPAVMLELRVVPYGDNQRLLMVTDTSDVHRLERIRRDFVSNASHELRTPLTVLRGYIEMMLPETARGQGLAGWSAPLAEMHKQATRMDALVRDLLKLARLEGEVAQGRQDVFEVAPLVERALVEARSLSVGRHRIETEVDAELLLYGRESEAESIFTNLVGNAVQYTPAGGQITVRWAASGEGAMFSVSDTGIGVAEEDIPRLTERFYRVDEGRSRASGGTGLGLSIVKHALERHEGRLEVRSVPGKGSTFSCHFPGHRVVRQRPAAANA